MINSPSKNAGSYRAVAALTRFGSAVAATKCADVVCSDDSEKWHGMLIEFLNFYATIACREICGKLESCSQQTVTDVCLSIFRGYVEAAPLRQEPEELRRTVSSAFERRELDGKLFAAYWAGNLDALLTREDLNQMALLHMLPPDQGTHARAYYALLVRLSNIVGSRKGCSPAILIEMLDKTIRAEGQIFVESVRGMRASGSTLSAVSEVGASSDRTESFVKMTSKELDAPKSGQRPRQAPDIITVSDGEGISFWNGDEFIEINKGRILYEDEIVDPRGVLRGPDSGLDGIAHGVDGLAYGRSVTLENGGRCLVWSVKVFVESRFHNALLQAPIEVRLAAPPMSETRAEYLYGRILKALNQHIIPAYVDRVVRCIQGGREIRIGRCRLSAEGFTVPCKWFFWSRNKTIALRDLDVRTDDAETVVSSAADRGLQESFHNNSECNAVLLGRFVKELRSLAKP